MSDKADAPFIKEEDNNPLREQFIGLLFAGDPARKVGENPPPQPVTPPAGANIAQVEIIAGAREDSLKREVAPNGNIKVTCKSDGSYTIYEPGKDSKNGRMIEVRDANGATTKVKDNGVEVREPDGTTSVYKDGEIGMKGTVTFTSTDGIRHERQLDGFRTEKNKDGSIRRHENRDKSSEEYRRNGSDTVKTTFVNGHRVCEETEFTQPASVTIDTVSGKKEFKNVRSISNFYSPPGRGNLAEEDKPIAQSVKFAGTGLPMSLETSGGKLTFNASSLDLFRPNGGQPNEMYYYSDQRFSLEKPDGSKTQILPDTLSIFKDNKKQTEVAALSSRGQGGEPIAYVNNVNDVGNKLGIKQPDLQKQDNADAKVAELIKHYNGKEGNTEAGRKAIRDKLVAMGSSALPALEKLAVPQKSGVTSPAQALAESVIAAHHRQEAEKILPENAVKQIQDVDMALLLAESKAFTNDALTAKDMAEFERLVERASQPLTIDEGELRVRAIKLADALDAAWENDHDRPLPVDPLPGETEILPLPLRSNGESGVRGAQRAAGHLATTATRQLAREGELLQSAIHSKDKSVAIYAEALSRTGNEADRKKAVDLLTKTAESTPNIDTISDKTHFVPAAIDSGAYKDKSFTDALLRRGEQGAGILEAIEQGAGQNKPEAVPAPPPLPPPPK